MTEPQYVIKVMFVPEYVVGPFNTKHEADRYIRTRDVVWSYEVLELYRPVGSDILHEDGPSQSVST